MEPQPGQDPSQAPGVQAINDSVRAASRSLDGTGAGLNQTLRNLVTMLADPYKADADYRRLFENSEVLSSDFLRNWDSFASVDPNASGHHPIDRGPVGQLRSGPEPSVASVADFGGGDQSVGAAGSINDLTSGSPG